MISVPSISVLTPSYNYSDYVTQTLKSVSAQADEAIEHVVVDDASTDQATNELLEEMSRSLVFARHTINEGLSATLNHAASLATGDWVGWLNTDDFYLPGAFSAVRRGIQQNPAADVIYGDSVFVDTKSRLLRLAPEHRFSRGVLRRYGPFIAPCALFVRRSSLPQRGWEPGTLKLMDWDLYLQLHEDGARFAHIARPLGAFRRHPAQASRSRTSVVEKRLVRERFDLPTHPRMIELIGGVGRLQHAAMKLLNGGYRRQHAAKAFIGHDMAWFDDLQAAAAVDDLLVACSSTEWKPAPSR